MNRQSNKITALYCRVGGSCGDMDGLIRRNQMERLAGYAAERGLQNPEFFCDWGFLGTTPERPEYQRMLREIDAGNVSDLVVVNLDRLWREREAGYEFFRSVLPNHGVTLHILQDNSISTPQDLKDAAARYEELLTLFQLEAREGGGSDGSSYQKHCGEMGGSLCPSFPR